MAAPTEAAIVSAVRTHLGAASTVADSDLPRLLATLELENDWTDLSAKKLRTILASHNLLTPPPSSASSSHPVASASGSTAGGKKKKKPNTSIPKSHIDPHLAIPDGVRPVYFNSVKGKGLVSTRPVASGSVIFTESAYIPTPPPEAFAQVVSGELCAQCFLPITSAPVKLAVKDCSKCKYRFCTSACWRTGMATHHAVLCVGLNPGARKLMSMVGEHGWQSLHCVARSLARLLSTLLPSYSGAGKDGDLTQQYGSFNDVYQRLSSFATVSELERRQRNPGWSTEKSSFESILSTAHDALRTALDPSHPSSHLTLSNLAQLKDLFTLPHFLKLLGRSNINMEKFGGLYSLHSFLNHSCSPNVAIRHVPERGILSSMRIAAIALRPIAADEELVISYIDPNTSLGRRQLLLYRDYCFGPCTCEKCKSELKDVGLVYDPSKHGVKGFLDSVARKTGADQEDKKHEGADQGSLEEELRASLGF